MAATEEVNGSDSAEKAYAQAAEKAVVKADAEAPAAPLTFPAKPSRESKAAASPAPASAPKVELPAELEADLADPALKASEAPEPKAPAAKVKPVAVKKTAPRKTAAATKPVALKKAATVKRSVSVAAAPKPVKLAKPKIKTPPIKIATRLKETPMATKKSADYTQNLKAFAADAQTKAKLALNKGNAVLSEAADFTKGNVEAVVASGKILASGLQDMGKTYVAEGKAAVETVTGDVKALAAVKSPSDFVQLQSTILRRNVDQAISLSSKNTEAMLKLVSDTFAPISARASLAVQKIKQAA